MMAMPNAHSGGGGGFIVVNGYSGVGDGFHRDDGGGSGDLILPWNCHGGDGDGGHAGHI